MSVPLLWLLSGCGQKCPNQLNAKRHPTHGDTVRTRTPQSPDYPLISSHSISINMNKVDKAIADLESRDRVESYMYDEVAKLYGCSRSAVSRR
jgi:hypothetical protein